MELDRELLARVLSRALATGGDYAEVFGEHTVSRTFEYEDGAVQRPTAGETRGVAVRVVVGDRAVSAICGWNADDMLAAAGDAAAAVRSGSDGERKIDLRGQQARLMSDVRVPYDAWTAADKIALLNEADAAARSEDPAIRQVRASYREQSRRFVVANSDGLLTDDTRNYLLMSMAAIGSRDGQVQVGIATVGKQRGLEMIQGEGHALGFRAARQALVNLGASPAPMGQMPVVINCGWGGVLFHEACGHGLEADTVQAGASVYEGRVGELVGSELVTAIDDPTIHGEWGSYGYDDEGSPSHRTVLIEHGVLCGYMHSRTTARRAGVQAGNGRRESFEHPPIPRMSNTFIAPGESDPEEIIAATDYGLFCRDLRGGQVNPASGDFVFVVSEGYMIRKGKLAEAVRGATLIGNGPKILGRIDMVGSDFGFAPGMCGKMDQAVPAACGQPTVRISEITVGGTQGKEG